MIQSFDRQITKYKSFQRQLFEFGFHRVNNATSSKNEYGAYYHELFVRDKYGLCHHMVRERRSRRPTMKKGEDHDSSYTNKFYNNRKQNSIFVKKEDNNDESITKIAY